MLEPHLVSGLRTGLLCVRCDCVERVPKVLAPVETIERGVDQGQAQCSIRIEQRVMKSDSATHRQADEMCSRCVQVVEQRSKVVGISKLCARGQRGLAEAAHIVADDAV